MISNHFLCNDLVPHPVETAIKIRLEMEFQVEISQCWFAKDGRFIVNWFPQGTGRFFFESFKKPTPKAKDIYFPHIGAQSPGVCFGKMEPVLPERLVLRGR